MAEERESSAPATPKLCFYPLPAALDPPGMATPPLNIPGSVPFRWEEAPGRPKRDGFGVGPAPPLPPRPSPRPAAARVLDLPPRLLAAALSEETKPTTVSSPTTVLDGPLTPGQPGCHPWYSLSFAEGRLCKVGERRVGWGWRRGRRDGESEGISRYSSSSSSSSMSSGYYNRSCESEGEGGEEEHETTKVTITRIRRSRSAHSIPSSSSSHWLANVYEIIKQVIPRRRDNKV